jgi:hypothetical protein
MRYPAFRRVLRVAQVRAYSIGDHITMEREAFILNFPTGAKIVEHVNDHVYRAIGPANSLIYVPAVFIHRLIEQSGAPRPHDEFVLPLKQQLLIGDAPNPVEEGLRHFDCEGKRFREIAHFSVR